MPILAKPAIVWAAFIYLVVVVAIGLWATRRTRSAKDFFIAGQSVGLLVTGFATMSAAFSGFVFIGGPGLTYRIGLASLFICVPVSFTAGLLCWVVAKRLRLLAEVREVFTIPDVILERFGSRRASGLSAIAVLVGTVAYLGAQLQALGVIIEAIFDTKQYFGDASLAVAMAIGLIVVVFYAAAGGMVAAVYTDLFQGMLMVIAAAGVFVVSLRRGGGLSRIVETVSESSEFGSSFFDPFGGVPVMTGVGFFLIFSVGTLGQPQMLHKFFMLDNPRKLRWMPLVVGGSQMMCVLIWLGIGLAVPALVASGQMGALEKADQAAPLFLLNHVPAPLAGLVFAGILAAIMSTADSFLNIGSAVLVRDLPRAFGRRVSFQLRWGRVAVLGVAFASALFALIYGDLIALLGTFAFGTFGAALAPVLAIGLNWERVSARAAAASIATGIMVHLGLEIWSRQDSLPSLPVVSGALPGVLSLTTSFLVLMVLTWWEKGHEPLPEDLRAVMNA